MTNMMAYVTQKVHDRPTRAQTICLGNWIQLWSLYESMCISRCNPTYHQINSQPATAYLRETIVGGYGRLGESGRELFFGTTAKNA
jgi:hypothetical protein